MAQNPPAVHGIHHFAYKCRNAEETRHFYEDILGLPLVLSLEEPGARTTTGEIVSFLHFFFEMQDGNLIAFFDLGDGKMVQHDPATPKFANHLAFKVAGEAGLEQAMRRLEAHGIPYDGPMVHDFVRSVYFWDPNGVRLEYAYTCADAPAMADHRAKARARFQSWADKQRAKQPAAA